MSTVTLEANHKLSCQLRASGVNAVRGVIHGATVVRANVQAAGKYVMLDAKGAITRDPELMASEVPVWTDDTTLSSLMAAAEAAGKKVKSREDHVDAVGARLGFADTFKQTEDGRVVADIHLLKSYKNRELVLETAQETPSEIGLSIDFTPTFELKDGRAYMRVSELHAVDVVDAGAVTPDGLFLSASVDTGRKVENRSTKMASPTPEELMSAISSLTTTVGTLAKSVSDTQAAVTQLAAKSTEQKPEDKGNTETLAAIKAVEEKLAAQNQQIVQMKREKALLGFRGTSEERAALATAQPEEIAAAAAKKKDYLSLVAERAETAKCKRTEAHQWVMKNHKDEYAAHLAAAGVVKLTMAA